MQCLPTYHCIYVFWIGPINGPDLSGIVDAYASTIFRWEQVPIELALAGERSLAVALIDS